LSSSKATPAKATPKKNSQIKDSPIKLNDRENFDTKSHPEISDKNEQSEKTPEQLLFEMK